MISRRIWLPSIALGLSDLILSFEESPERQELENFLAELLEMVGQLIELEEEE